LEEDVGNQVDNRQMLKSMSITAECCEVCILKMTTRVAVALLCCVCVYTPFLITLKVTKHFLFRSKFFVTFLTTSHSVIKEHLSSHFKIHH
jgi:hypothetical protein